MGNKITKMTPLNRTKYYILGILMMVASVISVFAFTTHYTSPENSAVHTIAAASIEDWTQVYNYEVDSSTSTVTITGLKDDYATLDGLVIPSYIGGNPVKTIGNNAFASKSAKTVYFASNSQVTTINEGAFSMYSLQYIQLPESLTTIWYNAFRNCSALKYLNIPKNLQYFGSTSDAAYGYLIHSKNLQYIDCDAANPYFTVVDNVLYTKDMKTLVLAPRNLTGEFTVPEGVERISNAAMIGMNSLTKIILPSTLKTIGNLFLADTSSVEEVIVPDSVTRIDSYFLANNGGVKLVKLSNSITRIEDWSIYGCANLTSIVIPEGVTHIGTGCFNNDSSLSAVVLPTTIQSISANTFKSSNITHMQKPYDTFTAPADTFTNKNTDTEIVWHDSDNMFVYDTQSRGGVTYAQIKAPSEEGKLVPGLRIPTTLGGMDVGYFATDWSTGFGFAKAIAFTPSQTPIYLGCWGLGLNVPYIYFTSNCYPYESTWAITGWFSGSTLKYIFVDANNQWMTTANNNTMLLSKDGKKLLGHASNYEGNTVYIPDSVETMTLYSLFFNLPSDITSIVGLEHVNYVNSNTTGGPIRGNGIHIDDITIPAQTTNLTLNYILSTDNYGPTTIRYEEGIETITHAGARSCNRITNVILPKSLKLIKANSFANDLASLNTTILIPSGCTVEEGAFPSSVTLIYEDQINWENVFNYETLSDNTYTIAGLKPEYTSLRSVTIPSQINGVDVTEIRALNSNICDLHFAPNSKVKAFTQWNSLQITKVKDITLPASFVGLYGIHELANVNSECLQNIYVEAGNPYFTSIDGIVYSNNNHTIAKFPCGRTGEYSISDTITEIGASAFQNSHLDKLYIPSSVKTIQSNGISGVANIEFADDIYFDYLAPNTFGPNYCANSVAIFPNSRQTRIEANTFGSSKAEAVLIPANITSISYNVFTNATNLKYLLFQGSSAVTIGSNAFKGCTSLPATVVVPDGSTWQSDSFPSNVTKVVFASDLWKLYAGVAGNIQPDPDKLSGVNTLLVPKTFNGTTVTTYSGNGVSMPSIGAIVFPTDSEVTSISNAAFATKALKYLYLPNSLTTMSTNKVIWSRAEGYDYPLESLYIPNNLVLPVTTQLTNVGYYGGRAQNGRVVDMPNIGEFVISDDNPHYKLIDGNLYTLDGTTLVATVKNDTGIFTLPAGVTTIGTHAFYQSSFSHINLNNGSLTTIWDGAFAYCNNLISIALPSTITDLSNAHDMFAGCSKLEHVEVPNNINLGVVDRMFAITSSLKGFRYSDSTTASGNQVFYAASIPFVLFNDGMTTLSGATFHGSSKIETVTIPASVTSIGNSAFAISNVTLKNIYLNPNNTSFVIQNGILYSANMKNLIRTTVNAPENIVVPEGVEYIYQEAFDGHASTSITLPSTLRNLSSYAFTGSNFTEIVIPEGVTTIGDTVFNSIGATSVTLPSSVTTIKNGAFSSSNNLVNVTLSEGTTTIESKAFNNLRNLATVNLPSTVTSIAGNAFYNCPKLQISTIPAAMTRIEDGAFKGNTAITSITIPNTVVYVGAEAFMNCTNLETVIFEAGSPLTTLGNSVFKGCTKLKTITLPQSLVAIPQSCFDGDIKLTGVTMPTTVRDIEAYAFQGTSSLGAFTFHEGLQRILGQAFTNSGISGTIVLPSTLNTLNASAFQGCTKITKVIFNNNTLTTIEANTFKDCSNLAEVVLPTSITSIKEYAFANTPKLKTINLPTGAYSLGNYAFYNTGLETLYVHRNANIASEYAFAESKSLKTIEFVSDWRGRWSDSYGGTYFVSYTFQNCTALESVILPSTLVHTGMGMFQGCTKLSSVTGYDPEKLTYIENSTFSGCSSLEYFNLSYARTINSNAFYNCTSLTNIVSLNSFVSHGVRVFAGCTNLRMNITIPATAASAFTDKGTEMFNGSGITGLTFAEGITTIPANFAQNCANLTTVVLPSTITKIGSYAFSNCTNLTNINNLPDGLQTIDSYAFNNCTRAFTESITIPSSVVTISNYAFYNCTPRLFDLSNASSLRYIYDYAFATSSTPSYEQTLLLPDESNSKLEIVRVPFAYQQLTGEIDLVLNSANANLYRPFYYTQYIVSFKIRNIASSANTTLSTYLARYATNLQNIYFDASINSIPASYSFYNCTNIKSIYLDGAIGENGRTGVVSFPWTGNTFSSSVTKSNINVYVAAADVDAYKADSYWSAFNVLSHDTNVNVTFHSLFGTAPSTQSVQVATGRVTDPGDLTCPEGYTFKGYYTYSDSVGYTKIDDFSSLVFYADTTIYCLWDGVDITQYLTFSTTTYNGVSGYAITGYTENLKYFPDLVIPRQYNGKDIITIGNGAFASNNYITSVDFVSDSKVMYFAHNSFTNCLKLTKFTLPEGILNIYYSAFNNTRISVIRFRGNPNLSNFLNGDSRIESYYVTRYEVVDSTQYAARDGILYNSDFTTLYFAPSKPAIKSVTIPNTVTTIAAYAFFNNDYENVYMDETKLQYVYRQSLCNITINDGDDLYFTSLIDMEYQALSYCQAKYVYFGGNQLRILRGWILEHAQTTEVVVDAPNITNLEAIFIYSNVKKFTLKQANASVNISNSNSFFRYCYDLEYIELNDIVSIPSGFFDYGTYNNLELFKANKYFTNTSQSIFNVFPDNLDIIVARSCYNDWITNPQGYNLSRFNIYPDEFEVTFHNDYDPANCYTEMHMYGDSDITLPVVTVTKAEGLYDFIGWYYKNENNLSVPYTGQPLLKDTTIFAVYDLPTEFLFRYEYDDENYTATVIAFDEAEQFAAGALVLPSRTQHNGETYRVIAVADEVFKGKTNISSITIPEGYVSIGDYAFEGASYLSRLTLPTSLQTIGAYAFANIGLTEYSKEHRLSIYATTIGERAFSNAGNPQAILLGEGLTEIGNSAFESTKFYLCNFPDTLETIGTYAFAHTGIYWDGETVTNLDASQAYDNGEYLEPNQNDGITFGANLRSIGQGAFKDNDGLYYVYCNDALESIGNYAFEQCNSLGYISLPTSMEYIGARAFQESNLYSVTIPYGVELGTNIFLHCYYLHDVTFRGGDITIPYSAFMGCQNLISVTFGDGSYYLEDQAFRNTTKLAYLLGPDGTNSSLPITHIGNYAFTNSASEYNGYELSDKYNLVLNSYFSSGYAQVFRSFYENVLGSEDAVMPGTGYTLDELTEKYEQKLYDYIIFASFDSQEELDSALESFNEFRYGNVSLNLRQGYTFGSNSLFANLYLEGVDYIGQYAFSESGVRNVKLGANFDTISSYTFSASAVENVTFDSFFDDETHSYLSVKNIYARAFEDTYYLRKITLPNGLERINANAFYQSKIKEIYISATVNRIAGGAFNYTRYLETLTVDSENPVYKSYNNMLFYAPNTNDLNSLVYYPYALTPDDGIVDFRKDLQFRSLDTVYDYAFAYNNRINELYFPKGLKLIKENAFYNSFQLRWLQIPGTIEQIEEVMYSGDYLYIDGALEVGANVPQLVARAFRRQSNGSYSGNANTNLTIYVPESDYERYESTVWGVFNLVPYDPEDKIVIITLELNGGSGTRTLPALLGLPLNVGANPVRSGYKFVGWFTDSELEDEYDMESIVENSFTLYAKWKPIEYSINYVMNGADKYADSYGYDPESFTFDEENGVLIQKTDYEYLVEGIQFVQPFMEGYNFIGWYRKDNFESELLTELDFEALTYRESTGDNPVTLYARFERIYYNVEFGVHEAYEINVIAGYTDPVEYGNNIQFTIVYHDGYTQNIDNQNIRLNVTTTSELKDDAAYREYYDIEDIEIGTSISYDEGLDEGIRIYTITSPVTDLSVVVEGIERNKYTISFAPNLSRFATGLANMPEPIVVRHGDNLIEDSTNAEYKMIMYGTIEENGSTYVYDMLVDILGYHRANLRIFKEKYDEIERPTSEFAYILKSFDSYNEMMTTYQALLDATTLYSQIFTNNPTLRIETSISGISSVEISTPTVNGYTFKSWNLMVYDSVSGETTIASRSFNMNQAITRDITLAADWNLTQYDIILALNGGKIGSSESETSTINYTIENGFTLPYNSDTIKQISRLGYSFAGWYEGEKDDQGHYISDFTVGPIEYIEAGTYGNKIYVAKWDLNTYDIIYQLSNGGHFSPETIASPDYHDTYTVLSDFDLPTPLRTGYEFAGWYETPNYTGNIINHISPNTREGDLILYAKWLSVDYLVIYHLNGNHISEVEFDGSIINYSNNIVTQTYTYNEVNDIEIATEVSRKGYSFAGWYLDPEFENRYNYIPAGTSGNIDVYAKWEAQEFTIILDYVYDKNLLVDGATLPDTFRYTFDDLELNNSITIQPVSVSLLDNSKFFAGWQSGVNIYSTISAANSNIVKLTAVWRNQKFDIFMTSNDTYTMPGSSTPIPVTEIVKMVGEDGDITNTYGGSLRFMLYYTNKAFSKSIPTVTYKISSEITTADDSAWDSLPFEPTLTPGDDHFYYIPQVNGNLKLYIDDLTVNNYTVHFLNADGTSISDDQFVHGSTIQNVPSPSKDGYNFAGWYMDSGITVLYNVTTPITSDLTLYARFALNEYVVTLKNGINNLTIDIPYSRQSEITFVPSTAPWEVEGYTAPQEYRIIDGSGTVTTEIITSTVGRNGNFAVFAVYGLKEYTITYGVEQGVTHTNRTHYNITDAFALTPASRSGYTFNYWTDNEGRIISNIAKGTTGDLTLSANFTLNSDNYVAVSYYDSYVKVGELAVYKGNVLHENEFTAPTKAGYTFVAWYVDEELTTLYTFGTTPMYQNLNLYAKYNLSSYSITYTYELYNAGTYVRAVSESRVQNINDSSFNVEDPFRFSNATSPGLKFLGWYVSGMPVVSTQNLNPENAQIVGRFDYVTYNIVYTIPEGMAEGIGDNVTSFNIDTPDITFNSPSGINPLFNFDHWANTIDMNERVDGVYTGTVGDVYVTGVFVSIENYIVVEFYIGTNMETSSKITKGTNALRPVEPTRTGYVLDGWYYSSDCTGPKYDFLTYLYANTKLYAKWNLVNYVLEVTYSRVPHHMPELPDTFNITSIINLPTLEDLTGYAFAGWYEGNNKIQSIIGRSSDLSIDARFELVDYTISYEGVSQEIGLPVSYNVEGPAYIDISGFTPEKEGYNFVGWSILDGNSWVQLDGGKFSKMLAKNVFIRAEFEFIPTTASLTLYLNGDLYLEQIVNIGEELELEEPTLAGYTFDGWYLSDDYTGDKLVVVTDSNPVSAYGRMLPITYTVSYDCNLEGVTLPAGNITSYSVNTPSFELINPSRVFGYTFDGWFTGAVLVDGEYNFDNATQISIIYQNNTDLQIVAKYTLTVYTITYQLGYGTNAPENVTTFTINSGIITLVAPIPPQDKAFSHWEYVDGEVAETWESFNAADVAKNITLYARYNDLKATNNTSEIIILAGVIGGSILFFVIITYSIVGSIKRKRTADARRIEELLTTLTREQNSNKQQTSSYRDDFRI